jgi:hypothetical protein
MPSTSAPTHRKAGAIIARPIPAWHASRRPECIGNTLAVLVRARALLADERRWCGGSFARGRLEIPVPVGSVFARRYCAWGAIMRAGREFGLPVEDARNALEWQTIRPVANWNDDPWRTHADVIAAFDGAIAAIDASPSDHRRGNLSFSHETTISVTRASRPT